MEGFSFLSNFLFSLIFYFPTSVIIAEMGIYESPQ